MNGIDRKKFALITLGSLIGGILMSVLLALLSPILVEETAVLEVYGVFVIIAGVWIWAFIQRLKNLDQSVLLFLLIFLPFINFGFLVYLFITLPAVGPTVTYIPKSELMFENGSGYCPKCGLPRSEGNNFCPKCGEKYEDNIEVTLVGTQNSVERKKSQTKLLLIPHSAPIFGRFW